MKESGNHLKHPLGTSRITRRSLVTSSLFANTFFQPSRGSAQDFPRPEPVALEYGLEIRDYRIFPTLDVTRFIVEIHNATDEPMDMPSVGFILPHLPVGENFGFAGPSRPILYPHTSGALIGVAPDGLKDDGDWGDPEWMVCGEPTTRLTEACDLLKVELSYSIEVFTDDAADVMVVVDNISDHQVGNVPLHCEVFDRNGRICGLLSPSPPWWLEWLEPAEAQVVPMFIRREFDYIGNPFWLEPDLNRMAVQASLQPWVPFRPFSCQSVLPWNRH